MGMIGKRRFSKKLRSGFEDRIKADLDARGVKYGYETMQLNYVKLVCQHCGGAVTSCTYTPDFVFNGKLPFVVEAKGFLDVDDRRTLTLAKRDNPTVDIRLLFQRDNVIRKGSKTRYSDWARKFGFDFHIGTFMPMRWVGKPELPPVVKERKARKKK